jgi:hypothetical protein
MAAFAYVIWVRIPVGAFMKLDINTDLLPQILREWYLRGARDQQCVHFKEKIPSLKSNFSSVPSWDQASDQHDWKLLAMRQLRRLIEGAAKKRKIILEISNNDETCRNCLRYRQVGDEIVCSVFEQILYITKSKKYPKRCSDCILREYLSSE